eukprot:COSAG02_NODE_9843_length_2095_cov_2.946673_4_plen_189_part_01
MRMLVQLSPSSALDRTTSGRLAATSGLHPPIRPSANANSVPRCVRTSDGMRKQPQVWLVSSIRSPRLNTSRLAEGAGGLGGGGGARDSPFGCTPAAAATSASQQQQQLAIASSAIAGSEHGITASSSVPRAACCCYVAGALQIGNCKWYLGYDHCIRMFHIHHCKTSANANCTWVPLPIDSADRGGCKR